MKPTILAPGPTKVHPELMTWLQEADTEGVFWRSHRSPWFEAIYAEIKQGLRTLLGIPDSYTIAFVTSANEAWERSIESVIERESFHLVGGEFGNRWYQYAKRLGRTPSRWDYSHLYTGRFDDLEVPASAEAICVTQNETSIGFWIPEAQIETLANRYPDKLMLVDVVSSVPHCNLPWDRVDLAYWSIQKGFNLPAGLGLVVISPRAVARCEELSTKGTVGAYHAFSQLAANSAKNLTAETPNVLAIYLLKRALAKYLSLGADVLRAGTTERAKRAYAGLSATSFTPLIAAEEYRSPTLIAITREEPVTELRTALSKEHGVYVGACYDDLKVNSLRIANFPIHTWEEIETGLNLLK
jgi:phosphoserine aminotransferase